MRRVWRGFRNLAPIVQALFATAVVLSVFAVVATGPGKPGAHDVLVVGESATSTTVSPGPTAVPSPPLTAAPPVTSVTDPADGIPRPDPFLTPGSVVAGVTEAEVCAPGYKGSVRNVRAAQKRRVFALYRIPYAPDKYEVDYLVARELGGSNDITNLWPEPRKGVHGARQKDQAERWLRAAVCAGRIPLADAQLRLARDWTTSLAGIASRR